MTWHVIQLGRPIRGHDNANPPAAAGPTIETDVSISPVTDRIRLRIFDEPNRELYLDPSNAYALFTALGMAITGHAQQLDAEARLASGSRQIPRADDLACDQQCYKLPRDGDGTIHHHPTCAVSLAAPSKAGG